jgi:hypothetical protein
VPKWYHRTIVLGDSGPDVDVVRRKLNLGPGSFDQTAKSMVSGMTWSEGDVTPDVAEKIGESAINEAGTPDWFTTEFGPHDLFARSGEDVRFVRGKLGLGTADDRVDPDLEAAVRRFQSAHELEPNGVVNEDLANLIGSE